MRMMQGVKRYLTYGLPLAMLLAVVLAAGVPSAAVADTSTTCTNTAVFDPPATASTGIISPIVVEVDKILKDATQKMYEGIRADAGFQKAVYAAMVLSVALWGAFLLLGLTQISLADGLVRLAKLGFIMGVVSATGWAFVDGYIGNFFNKGTDELVNQMMQIAVGIGGAGTASDKPLAVLDQALQVGFGARMLIAILALPFSGPYGFMFFILILFGMSTFFNFILQTVWIYLLSKVARALLVGMAPIFLVCLLFQRTRPLFEGWLNLLVSFSLQPILLAAFVGFYATLIISALDSILGVTIGQNPVCWLKISIFPGSPITFSWWQFTMNGAAVDHWTWDTPLPFNVVDVMVFLLVPHIAVRHVEVVSMIAKELSQSTAFLNQVPNAAQDWFRQITARTGAAASSVVSGAPIGFGMNSAGGPSAAQASWNRSGGESKGGFTSGAGGGGTTPRTLPTTNPPGSP